MNDPQSFDQSPSQTPQDRLKATLAELHQQLEGTEIADPQLRQLLYEEMREMREVLERSEEHPVPQPHPSLMDQLNAAATEFEASHPTISTLIGRVVAGLRELGI